MNKKDYTEPRINLVIVRQEESIASGSATLKPQNGKNEVIESWQVDDDQVKELDWNGY